MYDWFIETGIRVVVIIGVAVILCLVFKFLIPKLIKRFVSRRMSGEPDIEIKKRTDTLSSILVTITGVIILIIAILTILPEFGVNITTLIAGIGVGGLAIAFAAQNLVRDFINGFFILSEDQYRVGDVVTIAGIAGAVEEIGLRRTVLRDLDGIVHSVPNGKVEVSSHLVDLQEAVHLAAFILLLLHLLAEALSPTLLNGVRVLESITSQIIPTRVILIIRSNVDIFNILNQMVRNLSNRFKCFLKF